MWIFFAFLAAFFSGLTTIFAKAGINKANSTLVTGLRTIVIVIVTIIIYVIFRESIKNISIKTIIYIILSGITTALLWISYFKALSLANVNMVTPIDKTSIILTLILSFIFLKESITINKIISIILILTGTYLMVKKEKEKKNSKWIIYAILTAVFTSLATILGKVGIKNIDPNFATLIKTIIVLIIIWIIIVIKKDYKDIKLLDKKNYLFITLSGISTSLSWLFYFLALKRGEASIVFPIEKMSVVVAIIGSSIFLKEKLDKKAVIGLILLFISTFILIF